jgi:hypothetical protein
MVEWQRAAATERAAAPDGCAVHVVAVRASGRVKRKTRRSCFGADARAQAFGSRHDTVRRIVLEAAKQLSETNTLRS